MNCPLKCLEEMLNAFGPVSVNNICINAVYLGLNESSRWTVGRGI